MTPPPKPLPSTSPRTFLSLSHRQKPPLSSFLWLFQPDTRLPAYFGQEKLTSFLSVSDRFLSPEPSPDPPPPRSLHLPPDRRVGGAENKPKGPWERRRRSEPSPCPAARRQRGCCCSCCSPPCSHALQTAESLCGSAARAAARLEQRAQNRAGDAGAASSTPPHPAATLGAVPPTAAGPWIWIGTGTEHVCAEPSRRAFPPSLPSFPIAAEVRLAWRGCERCWQAPSEPPRLFQVPQGPPWLVLSLPPGALSAPQKKKGKKCRGAPEMLLFHDRPPGAGTLLLGLARGWGHSDERVEDGERQW